MKNWIVLILVLIIFVGGANFWRIQWSKNSKPPPDRQLLERLNNALQNQDGLYLSTEDFHKLEAFIQLHPDHREFRLLHARIVWRIAGLEDRKDAKMHLFKLGEEKDEVALQALHELTFTPIREGVSEEDITKAAIQFTKHPMVTTQQCLQAGDVMLFYNKHQDSEEFISELVKMARFSNRVGLVNLLFKYDLYSRIVELLQPEEIPSNGGYYFPLLISFLETEEIDKAQRLMDENKIRLSPAELAKSKAYLAKARGEENPARVYIDWAKSQNSMKDLAEAAQYSLLWGNTLNANEAFAYIFDQGAHHLNDEQCGQFLNLSILSRNTNQAMKVMEVLHSRYPERPATRNNLLWLQLLNEKDDIQLSQLLKEVEDLVAKNPEQNNFSSTLALAHLLLKNSKKALQALEKRGKSDLQQSEKALWAAAFYANENTYEGQRWAKDLDVASMFPEEWELVQKYAPPSK